MLKLIAYTKDTRISDVDYILDDASRLMAMIPYMKRKIEGEWKIALVLPTIQVMREIIDGNMIPEYVLLECYLDSNVVERLTIEKPSVSVKVKTNYEKYMDMIGEMKVMIQQDAAKELYRRVGTHKEKLQEYLADLSDKAESGTITLSMVKREVIDERRVYASEVLMSFLRGDRYRWKRYDSLVKELGRSYAFYALRKFSVRLLQDKNKYLNNQVTEIRGIESVDAFSIDCAYIIFSMTTEVELDLCMHMLDDRKAMRRLIT